MALGKIHAGGVKKAPLQISLLRLGMVNTSGHQGDDSEGRRVNAELASHEAAGDTCREGRGCDSQVVVLADQTCNKLSVDLDELCAFFI